MESGNLLGSFVSEENALAAVRDAVDRNGESYGEVLALGREDSRGRSKTIAQGRDLVARAFPDGTRRPSVDARHLASS
jgi:hypothetical protein